jgi:hypothetical protein
MTGTWKKLRGGEWGVEVIDGEKSTGEEPTNRTGETIEVKSRSGKTQRVVLVRALWTGAATPWNPAKAVYIARSAS